MLLFKYRSAAICMQNAITCNISPGSKSSVTSIGRRSNGAKVPQVVVTHVCQVCRVSSAFRRVIRNMATIDSVATIRKTLNRGLARKLLALAIANRIKSVARPKLVKARPTPRNEDPAVIDRTFTLLPWTLTNVLISS